MSNKMFNNLFKKWDSNPNRYKPVNKPSNKPEHNKDDEGEYLMDLGKLLCVVTRSDYEGGETYLQQVYMGTWDKIYKKFLDNFDLDDLEIDQKTNGILYEEYDKDYKNSVSENDYYKTNPKLIFNLETEAKSMYVVPMSEVEDLDKNTTGGGRRRKTYKNKRK